MQLINATNLTALNPFNHTKGLLVFHREAVVDLAPAERTQTQAYQVLARKTVTLRALGDDRIELNGKQVKQVNITGGPVLVVAVGNQFEVITSAAEVSAVSEQVEATTVEATPPVTDAVDAKESTPKPKAKRRRRSLLRDKGN